MKMQAATSEPASADSAGFERFQTELARLVARFEKNFQLYQSPAYSEASVRQDFLDPLFAALGWDIGNKLGHIPQHREVEIESRTEISGRQKRADYLFRTDRVDRFVCEAKKPAETLHAAYAFQAKRYAWNKNLVLAVLSDFEEIKIYLVGARPHPDDPETGHWKTWHYLEYAKVAPEMWNLLSRDAVAAGSIETLVASLPRKPVAKTKAKQQWLFKPERARAIDADFLDFLDEARRELASDLIRHNDRADLLEGTRLDEAVQRILDRLLFLRICEDRDIDTGRPLANILRSWQNAKDHSLWRDVVAHFRALDRRPASHIPYFNGNLFKEHFSETLEVSDDWISGFLDEIGDEESPYLFNVIPVEILGTIYERFLGKTVRPHGRGVVIEEKPEVRKAGGVYYTPRYIVDYIVEQTLGKLIEGKAPPETLKLRVLDPACGSGSFLIRAYERLCEHWQTALTRDEKLRRKSDCWTDPATGDLHLTTDLKRRILTATIYGVDLDPGAVEVSQLSLYLKMLEGESRATLAKNRELFGPDTPLLPPLQDNIKCGNSLIASDFSLNPDDLLRVRAFDWNEGFRDIMKNGGFDVVVGNPPYIRPHKIEPEIKKYFWLRYKTFVAKSDIYSCFMERGLDILKHDGTFSFIVPHTWTSLESFESIRRKLVTESEILQLVQLPRKVFQDATVETCIFCVCKTKIAPNKSHIISILKLDANSRFATVRTFPQNDIVKAHLCNFQLYSGPNTASFVSRLKMSTTPLGQFVDFVYGFKTADDDKFIHPDQRYTNSKPFIRSAAIYRYGHEKPAEYVWYEPEKMKANRLTARPGEKARFEAEKILVARMGKELAASYDSGGLYVKDAMLLLEKPGSGISLKYLLALINSRLLGYYYREFFITIDVLKNALLDLPIRPISPHKSLDRTRHDKLVALVDKMLLLVPKLRSAKSEGDRATLQNAVAATDRAIDAAVYELYGLTPEEIALVEKGP